MCVCVYQCFFASSQFDGLVWFDNSSSDSLLDNHFLVWNVGPYIIHVWMYGCVYICICMCGIYVWMKGNYIE